MKQEWWITVNPSYSRDTAYREAKDGRIHVCPVTERDELLAALKELIESDDALSVELVTACATKRRSMGMAKLAARAAIAKSEAAK